MHTHEYLRRVNSHDGLPSAEDCEQARESLRLCLAGFRIGRFDTIAEVSELPDHSRGALLL